MKKETMVKKFKHFMQATIIGGVAVLLPVVLTVVVLNWLFNFVLGLIYPITKMMVEQADMQKYLADILVIVILTTLCFVVGLLVETRFGDFIHRKVEGRILKSIPGYTLFRNTAKQFLGKGKSPFSQVALVDPFGSGAMMTAFVTAEHPGGCCTVFIPSALNPTTGLIFHMAAEKVYKVDMSVEDAMRTIISCGAGSSSLICQLKDAMKAAPPQERKS